MVDFTFGVAAKMLGVTMAEFGTGMAYGKLRDRLSECDAMLVKSGKPEGIQSRQVIAVMVEQWMRDCDKDNWDNDLY